MNLYRVQTENYSGPLDLLLYLIRKSEIDVFELTLSKIIEQYIVFSKENHLDVNSMGEFLLLATTLLEIKSKLILPREEIELEEVFQDPNFGLFQELLEYRKFKKLSSFLEEKEEEEACKFFYPAENLPFREEDLPEILGKVLKEIDVLDLFNHFDRLEKEITPPPPLVYHQIPIENIMEFILDTLEEHKKVEIWTLLQNPDKSWIAGAFIGILELVRQGKIQVCQEEPFQEIWIVQNN